MAEPDSEVKVVVTLTEQDCRRTTWTLLRRRKTLMAGLIGLGLFGLLMSTPFCLAALEEPELLLALPCLLFLPGMIFVVFPLSIWWGSRRAYQSNPAAQREMIYQFGRQGIASSNGLMHGEVTWEAIVEVLETKKDFLFFVSKQSVYLVPKAAIPSPDERQRLRRLVTACCGKRAKLQPESSSEDWTS